MPNPSIDAARSRRSPDRIHPPQRGESPRGRAARPDDPRVRSQTTAADLDRMALAALARRILAGGLTWVQVDARWPATLEALADCDPAVVAAIDDDALRQIITRPDILRGVDKLRTVVVNARAFQEISAEHGSVHAWLAGLRALPWEERVAALSGRFKAVRERTAWRFLREIGEPVPSSPPWLDEGRSDDAPQVRSRHPMRRKAGDPGDAGKGGGGHRQV